MDRDVVIPSGKTILTFGPAGNIRPTPHLAWQDIGEDSYVIELAKPRTFSCRKPNGAQTFQNLEEVVDILVTAQSPNASRKFERSGGRCFWLVSDIGGMSTTQADANGNCVPARYLWHWAVRTYDGHRSEWTSFVIDGTI